MEENQEDIVITGLGMVTPLGLDPAAVLQRVAAGQSAAAPPADFDAAWFACPLGAAVRGFEPQRHLGESKMLRLMNRDAQLAAVAARLALTDAGVRPDGPYAPDEIGLFGATGLAGLPLGEVRPLLEASLGPDGRFDLDRFGQAGLRAVSPVLSFKILSNMPLCFVSIGENLQGVNGIYTPWEGQGAQALVAGLQAIWDRDARCVLVGGCDVKTHELAFLSLQQQGVFNSWPENGAGVVPGEGAAFLVLEGKTQAAARGARVYARLSAFSVRTRRSGAPPADTYLETLRGLGLAHEQLGALVSADNGDGRTERDQHQALSALRLSADTILHPKRCLGDLFAAAALVQVGLGALLAGRVGKRVLAHCFGHGSEQAAFILEPA